MKIRQVVIYVLSICVCVLVSELLDNDESSRDKSTTNSLRFASTLAFATLCQRAACYIHGQEGTRGLQLQMYGAIGVYVFNVIRSMHRVIGAFTELSK